MVSVRWGEGVGCGWWSWGITGGRAVGGEGVLGVGWVGFGESVWCVWCACGLGGECSGSVWGAWGVCGE